MPTPFWVERVSLGGDKGDGLPYTGLGGYGLRRYYHGDVMERLDRRGFEGCRIYWTRLA